ncbi:MAG: DUF2628 domain-containing protein [Persephonella sp.]|nr:DUF2628 domain-containing protein [Persephonella sp.]
MDKWEVYRIFIGKNADYYIEKFKKFEESGGALSWNWAAFFLGLLWVFYRKMYLYGAIILLGIFLIGALTAVGSNPLLSIGIQLWLWIGFGAFGNYLYYTFVKKKVSYIQSQSKNEKEMIENLAKEGGTNFLAPVVFVILMMLLQILTVTAIK